MWQQSPRVTLGAAGSRAEGRNGNLAATGQSLRAKEVPPWAVAFLCPPLVRQKSTEGSVLLLHRALGDKDISRCVWYQGLSPINHHPAPCNPFLLLTSTCGPWHSMLTSGSYPSSGGL